MPTSRRIPLLSNLPALLLAPCVLLACADAEPDGGPAAERAAACAALADKLCATQQKCAPYSLRTDYGDLAGCKSRQQALCVARLAAPDTGRQPADVRACADALGNVECAFYGVMDGVSACLPKVGLRADNQGCGDGGQCQAGHCRKQDGAACGVCGAPVEVGTTCFAKADCQPGVGCIASQTTKKCQAWAKAGQPCTSHAVCPRPLLCVDGTCGLGQGVGAACDPSDSTCEVGAFLFCGQTTKQCTERKFAPVGGACGAIDGGFVACEFGGVCQVQAAGQGTCVVVPPDGEPCGESMQVPCRAGAVCRSGQCVLEDPAACTP